MATIKSYTDINQSKELAKILPLESADGFYAANVIITEPYITYLNGERNIPAYKGAIPCWSLAALLDVMPKDKSIECSISFGYYNGKGKYIEKWLCAFEKEGETTDDYIIETFDGDNPINACVAMIEKLHELNLL